MTTFCKKLHNEGMIKYLKYCFDECKSSIVSDGLVIKKEGIKEFNNSENDLLEVIEPEDFKLLKKLLKRQEWREVIDGKEFIKYGKFLEHIEKLAQREAEAAQQLLEDNDVSSHILSSTTSLPGSPPNSPSPIPNYQSFKSDMDKIKITQHVLKRIHNSLSDIKEILNESSNNNGMVTFDMMRQALNFALESVGGLSPQLIEWGDKMMELVKRYGENNRVNYKIFFDNLEKYINNKTTSYKYNGPRNFKMKMEENQQKAANEQKKRNIELQRQRNERKKLRVASEEARVAINEFTQSLEKRKPGPNSGGKKKPASKKKPTSKKKPASKKKPTSKKKVRKIHKGPRGGRYYITKGRKVYI